MAETLSDRVEAGDKLVKKYKLTDEHQEHLAEIASAGFNPTGMDDKAVRKAFDGWWEASKKDEPKVWKDMPDTDLKKLLAVAAEMAGFLAYQALGDKAKLIEGKKDKGEKTAGSAAALGALGAGLILYQSQKRRGISWGGGGGGGDGGGKRDEPMWHTAENDTELAWINHRDLRMNAGLEAVPWKDYEKLNDTERGLLHSIDSHYVQPAMSEARRSSGRHLYAPIERIRAVVEAHDKDLKTIARSNWFTRAIKRMTRSKIISPETEQRLTEQSEKEAPERASYETYTERKKKDGEQPLPREEWEKRYKKGTLRERTIRLAAADPSLRPHLLRLLK